MSGSQIALSFCGSLRNRDGEGRGGHAGEPSTLIVRSLGGAPYRILADQVLEGNSTSRYNTQAAKIEIPSAANGRIHFHTPKSPGRLTARPKTVLPTKTCIR